MEKKDARKRYTQMVLKQSLLKLLKEKPVNKITVKEVCELAQLNRATFYAHYSGYLRYDRSKSGGMQCSDSRKYKLNGS